MVMGAVGPPENVKDETHSSRIPVVFQHMFLVPLHFIGTYHLLTCSQITFELNSLMVFKADLARRREYFRTRKVLPVQLKVLPVQLIISSGILQAYPCFQFVPLNFYLGRLLL